VRKISLVLLGVLGGCDVESRVSDSRGLDVGHECRAQSYTEEMASCSYLPNHYLPGTSDDAWPACSADDGSYHMMGSSEPASAGDTLAFELIGTRTWNNARRPSAKDFAQARIDLASIEQGILRAQDVHAGEVPGNYDCSDPVIAKSYPDRCSGAAEILPAVKDALARGMEGDEPRVQAARIEASLIWFLYTSTLSEMWSCSINGMEGCDQAWGYFNGAKDRSEPLGLGRYFRNAGAETYQHAFDGLLAARCWRDVDRDLPAARRDMYKSANNQLDRAQLRGLALILRQRLLQLSCSTGDYQQAHFEFAKQLVGYLSREAKARVPELAEVLRVQFLQGPAQVNVFRAVDALDRLFPCP
jgi:hypothetical protein